MTEPGISAAAVGITPEPTDEEAAAIVAAIDTVLAVPAPGADNDTPRWRWSGRWWSKPVPLGRMRPW